MNIFKITIREQKGESCSVEAELTRGSDQLTTHHQGTLNLSKENINELNSLTLQSQLYGKCLGEALFQGAIEKAYLQAIDSSSLEGMRVSLTIEDPQLETLYWHWLCAPRDWNSISLNQRCCFSISLKSSTDRAFPPINQQDLKALILVANPQNLNNKYNLKPFDAPQTINYLKTALGEIPTDVLAVGSDLGMPTLDQLCDRLTQTTYTLLHIVSHGKLIPQGETVVYWATEDNQVAPITTSNLIQRLGNIEKLPRFVFLCACESAKTVEKMALGGLAQRLVRELGIPTVLAMTEKVTIETAQSLSEKFYPRLREHGEVDKALVEAISSLSRHDILVPALYRRLGNSSLFQKELKQNPIPPKLPAPRSGVVKFVGREKELTRLHEKLQNTEGSFITCITGMGGTGKTELALQYRLYHLQQKTYLGGICWLNARNTNVGTTIIAYAKKYLNLNPPDQLSLLDQVEYCWRQWQPSTGNVLVIFDDVNKYENIKPYLPPDHDRFKVLITTRTKSFASFQELALDILDKDAALELLISLKGEIIPTELEAAKALCQDLGYLPLGLELVGRYLKRKPDLSLAKMRERLELEHRSLSLDKNISPEITAERGVQNAFELSWKELEPKEQKLACVLSLFALAPIPWSLVESCSRSWFPENNNEEELEDWRDNKLVNLSLLQRVQENTYQFHPLIHQFFENKLEEFPSPQVDEWKRSFCLAIIAQVEEEVPQTPTRQGILDFRPKIPHLEKVAETFTSLLTDQDLIQLFFSLCRFYQGQGFYSEAEPWGQKCLDLTQKRLGQEHQDVATSQNNLALLYQHQGKYKQAESLFRCMRKQLHGPQHPDVATSLNNLASLYQDQGKYEQAEPLYLQALSIATKVLGVDHLSTKIIQENLEDVRKLH